MGYFKKFNHSISKINAPIELLFTIVVACSFLSFDLFNAAYAEPQENDIIIDDNSWEKVAGIRVLSIRQTAAGYMLDFRYKVLDPKKAALLIDKTNKPYLHVLKNGSVLQVPVTAKIGPLRQSAVAAKAGKNYFMFFGNAGRMVKPGDEVTIQIGDFKSKKLIVE